MWTIHYTTLSVVVRCDPLLTMVRRQILCNIIQYGRLWVKHKAAEASVLLRHSKSLVALDVRCGRLRTKGG